MGWRAVLAGLAAWLAIEAVAIRGCAGPPAPGGLEALEAPAVAPGRRK